MKFHEWSIRKRLILVAALPTIAAVLMLSLFHMSERWQDVRHSRDNMADVLLENLAAAAEYPVISGNYQLLKPLVNSVLQQPDIVSVTILGADNKELLKVLDEHYEQLDSKDIFIREFAITRELQTLDEYSEFSDITDSEKKTEYLATIELGMSEAFSREREVSIVWQSAVVGLLVVLAGLIIAHLTAFDIVSSLKSLAVFFTGLADGRLTERMPVDNGAELGQLQLNANLLAASLQRADREQQEFTARLLDEQQKTQLANQAKTDFLAMMSHEFRTPLNGAMGALQLLESGSDASAFLDYKNMADQSLSHLSQLLEDVLVVADIEKNKLSVSAVAHHLQPALKELMSSFATVAMKRSLSLVVNYDEATKKTPICTDAALVRQVLRHLIDNAIKFTNDGFILVDIRLSQTEAGTTNLVINVTDTGIGIPDHQKDSVLAAFSQVSSSFSRKYDGMGLGLTITHHISTMLDGSLTLKDNPGGGTIVSVEFPVTVMPAEVLSEAEASLRPFRVLVVEDNPVNLKVAEKILQKSFARIVIDSVSSGEACLQKVEKHHFDMVLMDCHMPGQDGFDTTRRIRDAGLAIPVIACTANTTDQIRYRCLEAGMNDFIAKPLKIEKLRQVLPRWL